uniref:TonB-dependent receptor-like beta-barrel domain-containing protein n=1 Tax=Panagrolaimus superbus TaxID=310955 RepID=A0A914YQT1_9BILA
MGGPGTGWNPFSSYLDWTGNIAQPNWNPLALASQGTITQKAGYAATRLSLADPLKLILGARYTNWKSEGENDDREHKVTTPYAGLVYDINDTYSAYASYTEIFQPQTARGRQGCLVRQPAERLAGGVPHRAGQRRPGHQRADHRPPG